MAVVSYPATRKVLISSRISVSSSPLPSASRAAVRNPRPAPTGAEGALPARPAVARRRATFPVPELRHQVRAEQSLAGHVEREGAHLVGHVVHGRAVPAPDRALRRGVHAGGEGGDVRAGEDRLDDPPWRRQVVSPAVSSPSPSSTRSGRSPSARASGPLPRRAAPAGGR